MIPEDHAEKVYAGLLGKCIGIRLGAPVEPTVWTCERIRAAYGEITGYVKDYRNFAADDDFNGPVFFIRALQDALGDAAGGRELTARDIGHAWLNYVRDGTGFFWWGGYGKSTEHTAYLNLKAGLEAPQSGSMAVNGKIVAEQIGGQIFVDTWGLVFPGDPAKAAHYAGMAASVSHDGEGINGGRFIAAAISAAFPESDPARLVAAGLSVIPADCEYARVVKAVASFHAKQPGDFRACMDLLTAQFGYDKYPGACHIIPNAGVCALALLYGEGRLSRTVEIATMCGWDTDCNAGNVGTIMGVAGGLAVVEDKYRKPMNDFFACSSVAGSLNIVDLPTLARQLVALGGGPAAPGPHDLHFDFDLPGSTHGFRTNTNALRIGHRRLPDGGALEVLVDRLPSEADARLFYKPFYRREDFDDERYSPAFSPTAYPGQTMRCRLRTERWTGPALLLVPYARVTSDKRLLEGRAVEAGGEWQQVELTIPDASGSMIDELGFRLQAAGGESRFLGTLLVDDFSVSGKARYTIDFSLQAAEFATITPAVTNRGSWSLEDGKLHAMSLGPAELYTGNYYARDVRVAAAVRPLHGSGHCLLLRAKGTRMSYMAGFSRPGGIAIYKNNGKVTALAENDFPWEIGKEYRLEASARGSKLSLRVDGRTIIEAEDDAFDSGMAGFALTAAGRCELGTMEVEEL